MHVLPPEVVSYNLYGSFWIDKANATQATYIKEAVLNAVDTWTLWQKSKLGRDLNPSELIHRVMKAGAKRVEIYEPTFKAIKPHQVVYCMNSYFNYEGLEDA